MLLELVPFLSDFNKNFLVLQFEVNGSTEKVWSVWRLKSRSCSPFWTSATFTTECNCGMVQKGLQPLDLSPKTDQTFSVLPFTSNWSTKKFLLKSNKNEANSNSLLNGASRRFWVCVPEIYFLQISAWTCDPQVNLNPGFRSGVIFKCLSYVTNSGADD